jgi:nucleoside-diphosphate-sugar epimerase
MKIFVTGATGFIGSAIVKELIGRGHQVVGLARSDASVKALADVGATAHHGALDDPASLTKGAAAADGVIHVAFDHDFSRFQENCEKDRHAIEALGAGLTGSDRPLIVTSGTALLTPGKSGLEKDEPLNSGNPRIASEEAASALASKGVRVSIVRLPPTVHGIGDHAFVPLLINLAREKGVSAYVGEGKNRWPAVHRFDAAKLYRLLIEKNLGDTRVHGVAEEGIAFRDIAEIIGKQLNISVVSQSTAEAADHFGWFANFAALDNPTSSKHTQELFGWKPRQPTLLHDLDQKDYFKVTAEKS